MLRTKKQNADFAHSILILDHEGDVAQHWNTKRPASLAVHILGPSQVQIPGKLLHRPVSGN